jgi:hypothetical protein
LFPGGRSRAAAPSGAQPLAALATTRRDDRPASPGAHAQPEAMNLRPPTVVRLERTLAHWSSRVTVRVLTQDCRRHRDVVKGLSLLTVWAMPTQVKLKRRSWPRCPPSLQGTRATLRPGRPLRGNYDGATLTNPERISPRRPRLWKTTFTGPPPYARRGLPYWGELHTERNGALRAHHVDRPVDNHDNS